MSAAVAVTVALLLASGIAYRIAADYLGRSTNGEPIPSDALERLPLVIGPWRGQTVPIDEWVFKATDADAVLNRTYRNERSGQVAGLYIAYGVRARDLTPHRPPVCYRGNGFVIERDDPLKIALADKSPLPCTIYEFTRAGRGGPQAVTVLNYYVIDGQYAADVSLLRSRAWRGQGGVRYVAQVQITSSAGPYLDWRSAEETVRAFAGEAGPPIGALFPGAPGVAATQPTTAPPAGE